MVKILYVEDEKALAMIVVDSLESNGFEVVHKTNGSEAFNYFDKQGHELDIVVLDVMMPIMDGFTLAEEIRKKDIEIPILFLTALTSTEDLVRGFRLGANDYIRKPFKVEELIVRIEALTKNRKRVSFCREYRIGDYIFDAFKSKLNYKGKSRNLSFRENEILRKLMENLDKVVTREEIITGDLKSDRYLTGRSLDVFISRLRKYLASDTRIQIINIRGVGYKLSIDYN